MENRWNITLKVSKSQKQISKISFEPKTKKNINHFKNSLKRNFAVGSGEQLKLYCLALKVSKSQKQISKFSFEQKPNENIFVFQ